ncbi:MAG: ribbon-helix-helix protein, CopG family [Spirochaetaceae bacterium]|jgi:RHH-type rel operon transcriptional repressor/antitoxin RelB|nr:ribbon-helix-helix protein, CopG family [Spirochaetaceae bacterium]
MSFRISEELMERLNNLADMTGRSKTYYVQEAVQEKISELEMIYLAKQRAENVRAGRSKTYTLDEVLERNGLSD